MEVVDKFGDKGKRVAILYSVGIQDPIILYQMERAIFLLNEEDREGHWGLRRTNYSRLKVLLEKCIKLILLLWCK